MLEVLPMLMVSTVDAGDCAGHQWICFCNCFFMPLCSILFHIPNYWRCHPCCVLFMLAVKCLCFSQAYFMETDSGSFGY